MDKKEENNIDKFSSLLTNLITNLEAAAKLYHEDYKRLPKAEEVYRKATGLPAGTLRNLLSIAEGHLLASVYLTGNLTLINFLKVNMPLCQQKEAMDPDRSYEVWCSVSDDITLKRLFEMDMDEVRQVYDTKTQRFRGVNMQKQYHAKVEQRRKRKEENANTKAVASVETQVKVEKSVKAEAAVSAAPTREELLEMLKDTPMSAEELAYLADAVTLMEAAKLAMGKPSPT